MTTLERLSIQLGYTATLDLVEPISELLNRLDEAKLARDEQRDCAEALERALTEERKVSTQLREEYAKLKIVVHRTISNLQEGVLVDELAELDEELF